mmetsp:Transcript_4295/g.12760  ORF Transcript_4295/g.12760 Transcript_4295/m.12760 type:complete len:219 (-) Transcript_4295:478-1134(-)
MELVLDRADPTIDLLWVLGCIFDGPHHDVRVPLLGDVDELKLEDRGVRLERCGLIEDLETQVVAAAVGGCHLDEGVHLADSGDVVWNEAPQSRVEVNIVGLVPRDIVEEVFDLRAHVQVLEIIRVVCALDPGTRLAVLVVALTLARLVAPSGPTEAGLASARATSSRTNTADPSSCPYPTRPRAPDFAAPAGGTTGSHALNGATDTAASAPLLARPQC